jgi:hypothetical protein
MNYREFMSDKSAGLEKAAIAQPFDRAPACFSVCV